MKVSRASARARSRWNQLATTVKLTEYQVSAAPTPIPTAHSAVNAAADGAYASAASAIAEISEPPASSQRAPQRSSAGASAIPTAPATRMLPAYAMPSVARPTPNSARTGSISSENRYCVVPYEITVVIPSAVTIRQP